MAVSLRELEGLELLSLEWQHLVIQVLNQEARLQRMALTLLSVTQLSLVTTLTPLNYA